MVDYKKSLKKVQVKSCSGKSLDLRRIHSNSNGYVVKRYNDESWDWLYVYNPTTKEEYLSKVFISKSTIALSKIPKLGDHESYTTTIDKQIDDLYRKIAELKKQKQEYLDTPKDLT